MGGGGLVGLGVGLFALGVGYALASKIIDESHSPRSASRSSRKHSRAISKATRRSRRERRPRSILDY